MIFDLEQERKNGLDESQLARDVMRLMGLSETCDGPVEYSDGGTRQRCQNCGAHEWERLFELHPRIPKPLREVRDELIEWLRQRVDTVLVTFSSDLNVVDIGGWFVQFKEAADFPLALALGAVRLMGKQDG